MVLSGLNSRLFGQTQTTNNAVIISLLKSDRWIFYLLMFSGIFLSPIIEELLFRGYWIDRYPEEDDIRVNLADIAIDEDKNDEALDYLNQVSEDSEAFVRALMVAADLYQTQELFEVSEQKLLQAQTLAPEEPAIIFALAELYFTMREFTKAIPLYLDLIDPDLMHFSYERYLENQIREHFDFTGTPIHLIERHRK